MAENIVRPGIEWGAFRNWRTHDLHIIPMRKGQKEPMPPHIVDKNCVCRPSPQPGKFDNTVWRHEYLRIYETTHPQK